VRCISAQVPTAGSTVSDTAALAPRTAERRCTRISKNKLIARAPGDRMQVPRGLGVCSGLLFTGFAVSVKVPSLRQPFVRCVSTANRTAMPRFRESLLPQGRAGHRRHESEDELREHIFTQCQTSLSGRWSRACTGKVPATVWFYTETGSGRVALQHLHRHVHDFCAGVQSVSVIPAGY
jgi:hypothetical protein